jgi:uncharacterized coiled-coil protein SlyX
VDKRKMTTTTKPIIYEYKDLGRLQLELQKIINTTTDDAVCVVYLMRANFEDFNTSTVYQMEFDDEAIRHFCTILNSDPDLIDDFLAVQPDVKILPQAISVEFSQRFGSKLFAFNIQIPMFVPRSVAQNNLSTEVVELQQKNNILAHRIKTLEQHLAQQEKNIIMLANVCVESSLRVHFTDECVLQCIEITGDQSSNIDTLIEHITDCNSKVGKGLLEMLKIGKLPKLKEYLISKRNELYPMIIGKFSNSEYQADRILCFCQLGIIYDITYEGKCYFPNQGHEFKNVKYSMLEYFNHQLTVYRYYCPAGSVSAGYESPEFSETCSEIRALLLKLYKNDSVSCYRF